MTEYPSRMAAEVQEIPLAVERLLRDGATELGRAASDARTRDPLFIATVARGSSDHACTLLKYAAELTLGLPVASIGPSVASIYGARLRMDRGLCLCVSQSGQSPDIVEMARFAREGGALTLAVTNHPESPLAAACDRTLAIRAGAELSVAATKTFVTSAVAGLALIAGWAQDAALGRAIAALPERLAQAAALDWAELREALVGASTLFALGRGPAFAISNEAALKFKETCQIHAESYSSAEVLHGPVAIVGQGFPVLAFAAGDAAEAGVVDIADRLAGKGAEVFVTSPRAGAARVLPSVRTGHALTDALALVVTFYAMVESLARARGIDPDVPRHLRKVTETV